MPMQLPLTLSQPRFPRRLLKTTDTSAKFEITQAFRLLSGASACQKISIKMHNIENRYTVYRRVCALFSPENLQAGAVKGVKLQLVKIVFWI